MSLFLRNICLCLKDTINAETVELLQPYFIMEDFNLETAKRVSGNVAGLCSWAIAMGYFYGINREVLPLKANLAVQESRLAQANANYNDAQSQLAAKMAEVAVVQAEFDKANAIKQVISKLIIFNETDRVIFFVRLYLPMLKHVDEKCKMLLL
mgnify:FL=1